MIHQDYANLRKIVSGDIIVKCRYGTDIRRVPISQAPNYDELCLMMYRLFKSKLSSPEDILLKYTDDEGDLISMTDDTDVSHAISQSSLLKITVFDKTKSNLSTPPSPSVHELKAQMETLIGMLKNLMEAPPAESQASSSAAKGKTPEKAFRPLSTAELAAFLDEQQKLGNNEAKPKPVQSPVRQQQQQQHRSTPPQQAVPYPPPPLSSTSSQPQTPYPPQNYPPPTSQQQSPYSVPPPPQPQPQQQQQQLPPGLPPSVGNSNSFPPQPIPGTPQNPLSYPPEQQQQQQYHNYRVSAPSAPPSNQYYYPPPPQQLQQAPSQQRPQGWN